MGRDGLDISRNPRPRGRVKPGDAHHNGWGRSHAVHSKPKLKIGPSVNENPSTPCHPTPRLCHPERSQAKREAIGLAESKDPYTLTISSFAARHSPVALRL